MQMDVRIWKPEGPIRGIVQLLHGMAEYIDRYDPLARALNAQGYLVAGHNHRGHGPKAEILGYFAPENGWRLVVEDAHQITLMLKSQYPGLPFFLLGHSMGSFVARDYALHYGWELNGLVLSGTGHYGLFLCRMGRLLARISPQEKPALLVDRVVFSGNNKPFHPSRTAFDWLSRDEQQVDQYIRDPLCGFPFTGKAFADFFEGLIFLARRDALQALPREMPVYFLSGDRDPVGQMGRGVEKVAARFRQAGAEDVQIRLYPQGRHEMFNEINRAEVYQDLIAWLQAHCKE